MLHTHNDRNFAARVEHGLLWIFILSRIWLFFATKGEVIGWDTDVHLQMLQQWPWSPGMWDVNALFYAYHPPIAFVLPKLLTLSGISPVVSVQMVAALASLVGFLYLRLSLKYLDFLHTWCGLAFLYITSSLPMQIYMARSINMDILVYATACAVLYYSILVFWSASSEYPMRYVAMLLFWLTVGLFTKFSAVLLLGIPVLVALLHPSYLPSLLHRRNIRRALVACCCVGVVVGIAFPYYYNRYYSATGQFFPSNMDLEKYDKHMALKERAQRDADLGAFWMDLFLRNSPDAARIQDRDQSVVRMLNTWKDLWSGNKHNVSQPELSLTLSNTYARFSFFVLLISMVLYALRLRRWSLWDRFGTICVLIACMELASIILYTYRYPHPPGVPNKGVYIAPVLLGLGYLLTLMLQSAGELRRPKTLMRRFFGYSFLSLLVMFMVMNAALPVY